jgi:hypothetical protein
VLLVELVVAALVDEVELVFTVDEVLVDEVLVEEDEALVEEELFVLEEDFFVDEVDVAAAAVPGTHCE